MKILKTILLSTALMMGTTFGSASVDGSENVLQNRANVVAITTSDGFDQLQKALGGAVIRVLTSRLNGQEAKTITLNGSEINENSDISDIVVGVGTVIEGLVKERAELKAEKSELEKALDKLTSELEALKGENADLRKRAEQAAQAAQAIRRLNAAKYNDDLRKASDPGSAESEEDDVFLNIVLLSGVSQPKNQSTTVTLSEEAKAIRISELEKIVEKGRPPEWKNADGKKDPTDSSDKRYNAFKRCKEALEKYDAEVNELNELKNNTNDEGQATAE